MALDVVAWAPEAQLLVGLLAILWYGSGPVTTPVAERWWSAAGMGASTKVHQADLTDGADTPASGPNHFLTHLIWWAVIWCLLAALQVYSCPLPALQAGGVFLRDTFAQSLNTALLVYAALALAAGAGWYKAAGVIHAEYMMLALLAILGQHLLIMTTDLMALYVCLELQSFSLVVLCSLNYNNAYSVEAGMKYFLLSAFSSCLLLLGIGLIYLQTGQTRCAHLQELLAASGNTPQLTLWLGLWLVGLGLLWKLAAAPLHQWAADVYQGAWSSVTLLISSLPKIAVLGFWVHSWHAIWSSAFGNALAVFSALSLMVGALAPLGQVHIKRLLAFSSVGHMGLLLMPLSAGTEGMAAMWAHMAIYVLTSLAIWGLLLWPFGRPSEQASSTGAQYIWDLAGLNKSFPVAATAWGIAMLSLAGLPPVMGFLGKLGLFWWALNQHQYALVAVALIATLCGSVYYLRVLKVSYVDQPAQWGSFSAMAPTTAYLIATSIVVLVLGLWHGAPLVLASHLLAIAS